MEMYVNVDLVIENIQEDDSKEVFEDVDQVVYPMEIQHLINFVFVYIMVKGIYNYVEKISNHVVEI